MRLREISEACARNIPSTCFSGYSLSWTVRGYGWVYVWEQLRHVCRVPGVSKVLVQRVEYPHVVDCEVVVEHLTILFDPLLSDRFWLRYEVVLETPAYEALSRGVL